MHSYATTIDIGREKFEDGRRFVVIIGHQKHIARKFRTRWGVRRHIRKHFKRIMKNGRCWNWNEKR